MITGMDEMTGKTIWIWRLMLWADDDPDARMKNFSISWYDECSEESIWQIDVTFWPPLKDRNYA